MTAGAPACCHGIVDADAHLTSDCIAPDRAPIGWRKAALSSGGTTPTERQAVETDPAIVHAMPEQMPWPGVADYEEVLMRCNTVLAEGVG